MIMQLKKSLSRGGKTLDLNSFENKKTEDNFISKFIEELKDALENALCKKNFKEESNVMEEYNRYERRNVNSDHYALVGGRV